MVDYRNIDMLIDEDPAYTQEENVDRRIAENERQYEQLKNFNKGVNQFLEPMIGEGTPIGIASDAARDVLIEGGKQIARPLNYVARQISSPDVTVADLQEKARTDKGIEGLKAQIQVPFEITGEIGKVIFDPKFYSDIQEKIKAGTSTQMDENLGAIAGAFEVVGGDELVRYMYKKFGPEVISKITNVQGNNAREVIQNSNLSPKEKEEILRDFVGGSNPGRFTEETITRPTGQIAFGRADMPGGSPGVSPKPSKRLKLQQPDMFRLVKDVKDGRIEPYQSTEYYISKGYNIPLRDSAGRKDISKLATQNETIKEFQIFTNTRGPEAQTYEAEKILKIIADNPDVQTVTEAVKMLKRQGFEKINASKLNEILGFSQRKRNAPTATPNKKIVKEALTKFVTPKIRIKNLEEGIEKVKSGKIKSNQGAKKTADEMGTTKSLVQEAMKNDDKLRDLIKVQLSESNAKTNKFSKAITEYNDEIKAKKDFDESELIPTGSVPTDYLFNIYRGRSGVNKNMSAKKFLDENYNKAFREFDEYKSFEKLEGERLKYSKKLQDKVRNLLDSNNGKYEVFKKELNDTTIKREFAGNKAHAYYIAKEGKEGPKGRFQNMADDPNFMFITSGVINNKTQKIFDPLIQNVKSKLLNNKRIDAPLASVAKTNNELNSIITKAVKNLKDYGFKKTKKDFVDEGATIKDVLRYVEKSIDELYMQREIGQYSSGVRKNARGAPTKGGFVTGLDVAGIETGIPMTPDLDRSIDFQIKRLKELMDEALAEGKTTLKSKTGAKFIKGLAVGGTVEDYTQNVDLMSDRFMKDPGFEEEDAFAKSLEGATAFNPFNIFKVFKKTPGVATPKNVNEVNLYNELVDTQNMGGADVGIETLIPNVKSVNDNDFAFKSFTIDKLNSANAPKNATPEAWRQFLKGGDLKAPETELIDSGMEDFFIDSEKMFPEGKISKEQLIDIYNESPVGNLEIKVKDKTDHNFVPDQREYSDYVGKPRHEHFGNTPMDNYGKDYREIVIQSGPIPNDKSPYVQGSHFDEPNVIGFTRVADYQNANGQTVAVIQELQTDLLTTVSNEQKRLDAMIKRAKKITEEQNAIINNPLTDAYDKDSAQRRLLQIQQEMGGKTVEELENTGVLKPFPTNVGRERIPQLQTELGNLQDQINDITLRQNQNPMQNVGLEENIFKIQNLQKKVFDDLASMNRETTYQQQLQGIRVPNVGDNDINRQLADYVESGGFDTRDIKTFPPVPFSRPGDYVDLLLKASIKDAQNRGITKIAIMPADVGANKRWSKTGDAAKRFTDLYDKKAVQELKNIKKKYPGAELRIENIIDPSKGDSNFFGKRIKADGTFEELTSDMVDEVPAISFSKGIDSREVQEDIADLFGSYGDVPAFVSFKQDDGSEIIQKIVQADDSSFKLSDDYTTQDLKTAQFMFDEFNPGSTPMYVIDISTSSANTGPMYLYRKKEGGTIDKDRLVSITDIYGSYGR